MWTKSQKISAAVLGLAVVAFGVDRWVLGSGDADSASAAVTSPAKRTPLTPRPSPSSTAQMATTSSPSSDNATATAAAAQTLAVRLAAFGEAKRFTFHPSGDAFRPCDEWMESAKPKPQPKDEDPKKAAASAKPAAPKVDHAAVFRSRHSLTAVMKKDDGGMAIVDGKLLAAGQTLDGFTLTKVGLADATFTGKGTTVTLRLPGKTVADVR